MFNTSTQRRFWILDGTETIQEHQITANQKFIEQLRKRGPNHHHGEFLTHTEESTLLIYYSQYVYELCRKFRPAVPMGVIGTSLTYFKRFYLHTSVMEFHPYYMAYLCVYLACKVDEYTVSIDQFMGQVVGSPNPHIQMFIIDNELLLIQKLSFHLTVHSPFRPMEGLIIDLKTHSTITGIEDVEEYRAKADKFLSRSLLTDVGLLYSPSQIAMSALYTCIGKPFGNYLRHVANGDDDKLNTVLQKLDAIKTMVASFRISNESEVKAVETKLSMCRDAEHDPSSDDYHARERGRKEAKDEQKKRKYQELCSMQEDEVKMLTYVSDGE